MIASSTPHQPSGDHDLAIPGDTEARLPAGTLVGGRFEVVEQLARGGMTIVYRALDRECRALVALKVVTARANRPQTMERFRNEARLGSSLADHPMLVRPLQVGQLDGPADFQGRPFLVTELVEGEALASVMSRSRDGLPVRRALTLARDVATVLVALHERGIVHRDIKPGNVIVTNDGGREGVRVIDFGIAYATGDGWEPKSPDLTEAGQAPGTPVYMPPEQTRHRRPTPSMDIYALGITLYELLAGDPPYHGMALGDLLAHKSDRKRSPYPIERLCRGLPEAAAHLVDRCLRHDPAARPSAADVVAILDDVLAEDDDTTTVQVERAVPAAMPERAAPTELPSLPGPGDVLGGRFEVIDEVGFGGMGHVYAARDRRRGETVALKLIIARYLSGRPERVKRFFLEFELANRIAGHPHVVQMYEAGHIEHGGVQWPYLSMELLEGDDLAGHQRFLEPWLPGALQRGRAIADTLRALHAADVVHRDVTSSNVWVCTDGSVKLIDFNLAGDLRAPPVPAGDPRRLTVLNDMLGNLHYMPPEQARREPPHPSADVYSFGLLLAELVTGRRPRQHVVDAIFVPELCVGAVPPVRLVEPGIPESVVELVTACTQVDPGARPSMDEVVARLDEAIAQAESEGWSPPRRMFDDERVRIPMEEMRPAIVDAIARGTVAPEELEAFDRRQAEAKRKAEQRGEPGKPAEVQRTARGDLAWPVVTMQPPERVVLAKPVVTVAAHERRVEPPRPVAAERAARVEPGATTGRRWWVAGAAAGVLALVLVAWGLGGGEGPGEVDPVASVAGVGDSEVEPTLEHLDAAATGEAGSTDTGEAGSSEGAQEPAPAVEPPQPEPEPPSTAQAPTKVKPSAPKDDSAERCAAQVQQARGAAKAKQWDAVLRLTKRAKCFEPDARDERIELRVRALFEKEQYDECATLGAGSSNSMVTRWASVCKARRSEEAQ